VTGCHVTYGNAHGGNVNPFSAHPPGESVPGMYEVDRTPSELAITGRPFRLGKEDKRRMRAILGTSLLICGACGAFGQAADAPAFEVASVKMNATGSGEGPGRGRETITPSPAGVTMKNVHLKSVVQWAYHLQAIQVSGPGWLDDNRYDIVAKTAGETPGERQRAMMQTLLAERFKLTFHRETKEMPAYVFTVAKGGHKLKPSESEGEMEVKPSAGGKMAAAFTHVTLAQLSEMASSPLQGVVVDQTGLKGGYDFTLDMAPFIGGGDFRPTGIEDVITMIIQAANEQLGIKIEQKKVPAEILIVDHVEKVPVEN
jgi:uncharacterized protein (TIGR03435 family)